MTAPPPLSLQAGGGSRDPRKLSILAAQLEPNLSWRGPCILAPPLHCLQQRSVSWLRLEGRQAHILINVSLILFTQRCWENEMRSWLQKHFGRLNASHRCRGGDVTGSLVRGGRRGRETEPKINFTHFPQPRPGPHQLLACKMQPHSGLCPLTS